MIATESEKKRQPAAIAITDAERQPCEIWTRVMGYHRPVSSFNTGKQGEHQERCFFQEGRCAIS
jgi:anaerobic ribonucleoside-triphosphate reductase